MKPTIQLTTVLLFSLLLTGCLSPVKNEIPLVQGGLSVKPTSTNDTKLVIFNISNSFLYKIDGSGRINVKLNGQGVAQLKIGHYAQVIVPKGRYKIELTHRDMADITSDHNIEFRDSESFVEIYSNPLSTQ